jgi:hypothetical protein
MATSPPHRQDAALRLSHKQRQQHKRETATGRVAHQRNLAKFLINKTSMGGLRIVHGRR